MMHDEHDDAPALPFDLSTPEGWQALGRAYQIAHAADSAALDAFSQAERDAAADPDARPVAPNETHSDARARIAHNDTIRARHGVDAANARQSETSDRRFELVWAALQTRAPDRAALALKLDMISDEGGWNDFDGSTWLLFVADLRRLCGLSLEPQQ